MCRIYYYNIYRAQFSIATIYLFRKIRAEFSKRVATHKIENFSLV